MKNKLQRGKPLEELVKGSMDYTMQLIGDAFRLQFPYVDGGVNYWIVETFADHVVVKAWNSSELKADEYWKVTYARSGEAYTFAARDQWEVVELAYQPQTAAISESKKKKGKRIEEAITPAQVHLLEAKDEANNTRRIRINDLMVADVVNGNKRLYSRDVIEAMVADWQPYLRESRGQGRLMILTGEVEHPSDKGKKRPEFLETVVRWDTLDWDGKRLNIEGNLILTSKGRDVEILMEAGVNPGGSIRGIGESKIEKVNGEKVERIEWASMNAADLVGDPSFLNTAALQESQNQSSMEDDMDLLEQLKKLLAEHPDLFNGLTEAQLDKMGEKQMAKLMESLRSKLGLGPDGDVLKAIDESMKKAAQFDQMQAQTAVETAITEACKDLPFGKKLNEAFVEALKDAKPTSAEQVKTLAESKRKEYGKLASARDLKGMGFDGPIEMRGSVLENETGTPEYARAAFEISESLRRHNLMARPNLKDPVTPNELFVKKIMERFDKLYMQTVDDRGQPAGLMLESRRFEEAELTTDLSLPYSVSRALYDIVGPTLVAASIFDVGVIETSPTLLFFKHFAGETGYSASVANEVVTGGAEGVWYSLTKGRLTPESVVVTSNPAGTTYVEGTDYVIDYAAGRIKFLAGGSINANDVLVSFDYKAIRKGEMAPIERAKVTLDSMVITAAADRLADQISREAVVFSRSQLGFDAIGQTMAALIQETQRIIDQGLLYAAYSAVKAVANNSTAPWAVGTTQDDLDELVRLMGAACIIINGRYYPATFHLMSDVNAERLSHWNGFKRDGFPNAVLNAAGYAGNINGKPIFSSTEFPSSLIIAGNRELVAHRVLQPMIIKGPYPTYDVSGGTSKIVAADQYYTEEFNVTESPINEKGAYVPVTEEEGS